MNFRIDATKARAISENSKTSIDQIFQGIVHAASIGKRRYNCNYSDFAKSENVINELKNLGYTVEMSEDRDYFVIRW